MTCRSVVLKCGDRRVPFTGTESEIQKKSAELGGSMHGGHGYKRVDVVDKGVYDRYPQYRKNTIW